MLKIGHRGAKAYAPENTLTSFRKAVDMGVDMVEVDVRLTKDGHLVAIHDNRLRRLTQEAGRVNKLTLAELRKIKIFKHEPIPTLGEVLEVLDSKVCINIELKVRKSAELVVQAIRDYGIRRDNILISSNYPSEIRVIERLEPEIRTALLFRAPTPLTPWLLADILAFILFPITKYYILWLVRHARADYLNINRWLLSKRKVQFLRKHGIRTCVWTVDNPKTIAYLKELQVDGIITNYPDRLL